MNARRYVLRGFIALGLLLVVVAGAFVIWASMPLGPADAALTALASDDLVVVETSPWLTFRPATGPTTSAVGFILYPGGRVDERSYAPVARAIAAEGYTVVIVPMPLHLAFFASNRAAQVMAAMPEVQTWAIGGHSLGGAMAARYADRQGRGVGGIVLWAAYPAEGDDLSARQDLAVLSIYATRDGLMTREELDSSRRRLPAAATCWVELEGGNHAQFGAYGDQPRDLPAVLSVADQQAQIATATAAFLDALAAGAAPSTFSSLAICDPLGGIP